MSVKKRKYISLADARRLKFVDHFCQHMNAAEAIKAAGFSPNHTDVQVSRVMKSELVQAELRKRLNLATQRAKLDPSYVLNGLREIYERCMQAKPRLDRLGRKTGEWTFNPVSAIKALELLGKNFDLWAPDVVVNLNCTIDKELTQARRRAQHLPDTQAGSIPEDLQIKDITNQTQRINPGATPPKVRVSPSHDPRLR
jgi:phage terminase small subunit